MVSYSGSSSMTYEDLVESTRLVKTLTPSVLQKKKEALGLQASSVTFSRVSDIHHGSRLFTELYLSEIEKMFEENDDSTGALDMDTFIKAMKKVLSGASEDTLKALFLKVDSDCNGFVTWEKYMDYMMHEFQGKEEMRKNQYRLHFILPMTVIPLNHGCEIVKVEFLTRRFKKVGCFLTVTKDGTLQFWSESFLLIKSFWLHQQLHSQQLWVTDMVCLHNNNLVAVATAEQKIEFFDISNYQCVRAFTFADLDSCVLVMDYWSDYHRGVFCYGDTKGNVIIFTSENVTDGLFNPSVLPKASKRDHWIKVSMQKLLNEKSAFYRSYRMKALHPNWCQKVKFIHQVNLVASCSAIEKSSLVLTVLPFTASEKPTLTVLNLRKGILCFDYCADKNFLVTGGYNPIIHLWNPSVSKKPVWMMKGHQTSVTHVIVNNRNSSILISVSRDKNIRVWDMDDQICLQSLCGKRFALGNCPITSAYFHKDDTLICSTYSIGILKGYLEAQGPMKAGKITTHGSSLCAVLYSRIFKEVVTGSLQGSVNVWEIVTGTKLMEFSVSGAQSVELTAMALDESQRCLLTGLRDGTMKMWNYNIGECLLVFPNPDQLEISGIVHMNEVFYVTGWSKRITCFMFHKTRPVLLCYHWQTFHTEDILSMAKYRNQFLGTSSYNGDILFWNTSIFKPIFNFNASEGPLPLQPKRVKDVDSCSAPSIPCAEPEKWAYKSHRRFSVASANPRRSLTSSVPVIGLERDMEPDRLVLQQKRASADVFKWSSKRRSRQSSTHEAEVRKEELQKNMLLRSRASVEKIIFLHTRPRHPHVAALLSSCSDGYIYAWSIHGSGGLLGKFSVELNEYGTFVVGAMATDKNDYILVTGDSQGQIKIWDIKDYCVFTDQGPSQSDRSKGDSEIENKFRVAIPQRLPQRLEIGVPHYIPLDEKEVVAGHTISLVPPKLLITWNGHLDSVTDILYVDSFQLVISAGQDRNVKAWKLSGDAIGTFGLSMWKILHDTPSGLREQTASKEKADSTGTAQKASHLQLPEERDAAEAQALPRQEQEALLALLNAKANEAEAGAKLQKPAPMSPEAEESSLEDIEESWNKWESQGRQVSIVLGTAYKPRKRGLNTRLLSTQVQYGLMKQQISPQIYQSLYFAELMPTQQLSFPASRGLRVCLPAPDTQKDLEPGGELVAMETSAYMLPVTSSPSSLLSPTASASRLPDSTLPAFLRPQSSSLPLHPWLASRAQSTYSVPSPVSEPALKSSESSVPAAASPKQLPRPPKAAFTSAVDKGPYSRF
ncbi:EF-hand calcium-binding domain-containing protein 8 [Microcebus murinus]|uniref:EF-hand calcium-binding domain-containing protein 8 n=1 Tax=Microcebus murinus TaxID=30608 RepID=UPI003F6C886C